MEDLVETYEARTGVRITDWDFWRVFAALRYGLDHGPHPPASGGVRRGRAVGRPRGRRDAPRLAAAHDRMTAIGLTARHRGKVCPVTEPRRSEPDIVPQTLVGISFPDLFRAQEFLTALQRPRRRRSRWCSKTPWSS